MTVKSVKIYYDGTIFNEDGTPGRYRDTGELMYHYKDDDVNPGVLEFPISSSIALGNGYFLTAAHSFEIWAVGRSGLLRHYKAEKVQIGDKTSSKGDWYSPRGYDSRKIFDDAKANGGLSGISLERFRFGLNRCVGVHAEAMG